MLYYIILYYIILCYITLFWSPRAELPGLTYSFQKAQNEEAARSKHVTRARARARASMRNQPHITS